MTLVDRLDDFGKPAWIVATVLSFVVFWPLGVLMLGFLIGSGRMGCWGHHSERWQDRMERAQQRMQDHMDRAQERMQRHAQRWCGGRGLGGGRPSGNRAFDEYRTETLRRLEDEQREFKTFLDRLRDAKDKAEFDQFLDERRRRASGGSEPSPGPA